MCELVTEDRNGGVHGGRLSFRGFYWSLCGLRGFFGCIALKGNRETLWALLDLNSNLVAFRNDRKKTLQALLQEIELHVLVAAPEEEVDFHAMAFFKPL